MELYPIGRDGRPDLAILSRQGTRRGCLFTIHHEWMAAAGLGAPCALRPAGPGVGRGLRVGLARKRRKVRWDHSATMRCSVSIRHCRIPTGPPGTAPPCFRNSSICRCGASAARSKSARLWSCGSNGREAVPRVGAALAAAKRRIGALLTGLRVKRAGGRCGVQRC